MDHHFILFLSLEEEEEEKDESSMKKGQLGLYSMIHKHLLMVPTVEMRVFSYT